MSDRDKREAHRVWDQDLNAMRELREDEWELESHWAGLLEVHGEKMPGHQWVIVVPKYKLDAAEARATAAEAREGRQKKEVERLQAEKVKLLRSGRDFRDKWVAEQLSAAGLREALREADGLLNRLHGWDVMSLPGGDGEVYWKGEITRVRARNRAALENGTEERDA